MPGQLTIWEGRHGTAQARVFKKYSPGDSTKIEICILKAIVIMLICQLIITLHRPGASLSSRVHLCQLRISESGKQSVKIQKYRSY